MSYLTREDIDTLHHIDYSNLLHYPETSHKILSTQVMARSHDTNSSGAVFGGWIFSQMDTGVAIVAQERTHGPVATLRVDEFQFLDKMGVGEVMSVYCILNKTGNSSIRFQAEAWARDYRTDKPNRMVASGIFTFVAVDKTGRPRTFVS